MAFVTKLTLESGDRVVLDEVVGEIKRLVSRKGAEMKGPHPGTPRQFRVSQQKHLSDTGPTFDPWTYTVYTRTIEIVGHDSVARTVATRTVPDSVHVEVEVKQVGRAGSRTS